LLHDLNITKI